MKYLLDVNALVALGFLEHEFHERVARWVRNLAVTGTPELATCSITELGFVRVLAPAPQYGFTVGQARDLLQRLKAALRVNFTLMSLNTRRLLAVFCDQLGESSQDRDPAAFVALQVFGRDILLGQSEIAS